ncbi:MAG: response regulator transcription factor [Dehalococcoidia bacterium]|nr:response regulator transcription factor [Dehalococcoidia bacterium]
MEPIRVVLGEDHSLVREGTRRILEQYPDLVVVGEAGDGEQALEMVGRLQPDVAILDVRMPKLSGIEVVRRIKACSPNTKALMLTAYDDDDYILASMEAEAAGYLLKTARASELVEAVRSVHAGESVLHPAIAAKVARLWGRRRVKVEQEPAEALSPREREVMDLAAKGLRNKDIAEKLSISVRTVEGHFNSIFAKLGVSSRVEAILYAVSLHTVTPEEDKRT